MLGSGAIVVMDETTDMVKAAPAGRALLRPRVLRQVHAVPRGHDLAREDPRAHPRRPRPPERPRPAARRLRQHQPRHRLAARSRPRSARSARPRCRPSPRRSCASRTSSRPTSAAPVEITVAVNGAAYVGPDVAAQPQRGRRCLTPQPRPTTRDHHRQRPARSRPRRASWSSTPPSATASTSRGSATTRA